MKFRSEVLTASSIKHRQVLCARIVQEYQVQAWIINPDKLQEDRSWRHLIVMVRDLDIKQFALHCPRKTLRTKGIWNHDEPIIEKRGILMWIKIIFKKSYNTNFYLTSVHYFMLFSQICESFYYLEMNEKEINLGSRRESWMLCLYKNSNWMQLNRNPKM